MELGNVWEDFCNRACGQCAKRLIGEKPEALIFIQGEGFYHERCYQKARRHLAGAMALARLSLAVNVYIAYREDIGVV